MDPLVIILPEIHDWIFQHFIFKDFLEITEVSPNWNQQAGKSLAMMKKVKLELKGKPEFYPFTADDARIVECLLKNNRRYRNVYACYYFKEPYDYLTDSLLDRIVTWSPMLLELSMREYSIWDSKSEQIWAKIDLTKLTKLRLDYIQPVVTNLVLSRCSSLTVLKLMHSKEDPRMNFSIPNLRSFVERHEKLEELKLSGDYFNAFFEEDISEVATFKLKRLKIRNVTMAPPSTEEKEIERNFYNFLKAQRKSLQWLDILYVRPRMFELIINDMPALRTVEFFGTISTENLQLRENKNIVDFNIWQFEEFRDLRRIVRALPKLQKLGLLDLNLDAIEIIRSQLPELQIVHFTLDYQMDDGPLWRRLWPNAIAKENEISTKSTQMMRVEKPTE